MKTQRNEHKAVGRFVVTIVVLLVAFFVMLTQTRFSQLHVIDPYTTFLARSLTVVLRALGLSPVSSGNLVVASGFNATIVPSCAGLEIMALLAAAMLAFPAPLRYKMSGVLLGLLLVHVINVGRLVVLFLIGIHFRSGFDQAHYYYAQGFLLLATAGVWALWVSRLPNHALTTRH